MTRDELIAAFEVALNGFLVPAGDPAKDESVMLDKKSKILETIKSLDEAHTVERHILYYWDTDDLNGHNHHFYVVDRGAPAEVAYWMQGRDPKPPAPPLTFEQRALAWLRALIGVVIGPYTIKYIPSVNADEPTQTGVATVLVEQAGALKFIQVYLYRDGAGDVQWQVIPAV